MSTPVSTPAPLAVGPEGAATMLGVSARSLRRWRADGIGPKFTPLGGNKVVYRVSDLDAWLVAVQRSGDVRTAVVR